MSVRPHPKDGAAHCAYTARDPLAVRLQFGPRVVRAMDQVQFQSGKQLAEVLVRHIETMPGAGQLAEDRVLGTVMEGAKRLVTKASERAG